MAMKCKKLNLDIKLVNFCKPIICGISSVLIGLTSMVALAAPTDGLISKRPITALVLSGGGARGTAHIGVLKVLEEMNIPIDMVVGTSMGSIVGGLYSVGYSPNELETLVKKIDWSKALRDKPPRDMISYRRKKNDQRFLDLEMGLHNGKLMLPEGARAGQELGYILKTSVLRTPHSTSFDQLPIPFRAVATDIETGDMVVLSQGDLAKSIRASMSVPGAFVPVMIDGRKLVDGGIVSNLAVDVARDMGAQRIIAVDIGTDLTKGSNINSVLDIARQTIGVLTQQNVQRSIKTLTPKDIYIKPELGSFSAANFKDSYSIIKNGYAKADSMRDKLKPFAVSPQAYAKWQANQRVSKPEVQPVIDMVKVKGVNRVDAKQVLGRMQHGQGSTLNMEQLSDDLKQVYAIGDFESVDYDIIAHKNGDAKLIIDVTEKPWGPNYLRGAIHLDDDLEGGSNYNLILNHRLSQINDLGAEWENTLQIGQNRSFTTEFYQPLTYDGRFFVSPQLSFIESTADAYDDNERVAEYSVTRYGAEVALGWTPTVNSQLALGLEYAKVKTKLRVGSSANLPQGKVNLGSIYVTAGLDQLDSPYFPKKGIQISSEVRSYLSSLGADYEYTKGSIGGNKFWTRGRGTYGVSTQWSGRLDKTLPIYDQSSIGGLGSLSGYSKNEISGQFSGLLSGFYYRSLAGFPGNLGFSLEAGNVWQKRKEIGLDNLQYGGSVFWSYDSLLGAIYLSYGVTGGDNQAFHLNIGQPF